MISVETCILFKVYLWVLVPMPLPVWMDSLPDDLLATEMKINSLESEQGLM